MLPNIFLVWCRKLFVDYIIELLRKWNRSGHYLSIRLVNFCWWQQIIQLFVYTTLKHSSAMFAVYLLISIVIPLWMLVYLPTFSSFLKISVFFNIIIVVVFLVPFFIIFLIIIIVMFFVFCAFHSAQSKSPDNVVGVFQHFWLFQVSCQAI